MTKKTEYRRWFFFSLVNQLVKLADDKIWFVSSFFFLFIKAYKKIWPCVHRRRLARTEIWFSGESSSLELERWKRADSVPHSNKLPKQKKKFKPNNTTFFLYSFFAPIGK